MSKNIYAHTEPCSVYPGFVSLNETVTGLSITVRSPRRDDGSCSSVSALTLSLAEADELCDALTQWRQDRGRAGAIGARPPRHMGSVVAD